MSSDELNTIIEQIASGTQTATNVEALRVALTDRNQGVRQLGKYNVNIGQGQDIHIGDRTYVTWNDEAIQALIEVVQKLQSTTQTPTPQLASVDDLVQQVRSRLYDDIQCLHGTIPLWGVDHWLPLGELFVDVNILEELSSSRKSELDDLWQDFTTGMQGYSSNRSLDRIGLGKERQRVSGLEVLAKNTNLMVVGKPGSGKTTYLQRVVTECNAGNLQAHRIPVLIKLREFVDDGREVAYSLERYLERCWRLSDAETQLVLDRGRALVLLDGLDEVTGEDGKKIAKEFKRFARAYPQVQVIVTCRTQSQESRFERFDYVEVADFDEPQVRAFAQHWFKTVMGDKSAGLARAQEFLEQLFLEENKPIRELAITPILLSLTCAVFHQTGKFYSKRSKLYEEGLELLLEQWDKSREIERDEIYRDLSVERKLELLSYLAVKKFEQPQYLLFEQAEVEGYIAEFLGIGQRDSRVVLKAIEAQHGLLIERSQKIWSFSHLTFQEYCTAYYIGKYHSKIEELITKKINNNRWREVFILIPSMMKNSDVFFGLINNEIKRSSEKSTIYNWLKWADQVASKSKVSVSHNARIALAIFLGTTFISVFSFNMGFEICDISLTIALKLDFSLKTFLSHIPGFVDTSNVSLPLHRKLRRYYSRAVDADFDFGMNTNLFRYSNLSLTVAKEFFSLEILEKIEFTELIESLEKYHDIIPDDESSLDICKDFAQNICLAWLKVLQVPKKLINSSQRDARILLSYLYIIELMLVCKEECSEISMQYWKSIEDLLLLPISEIEKRKREKLE